MYEHGAASAEAPDALASLEDGHARLETLVQIVHRHIRVETYILRDDFAQMRKGSVERRLQRWGYQARRVLVLLTDQNLYPDTEVLADQAAQNGIEVIPVQFDNEFK